MSYQARVFRVLIASPSDVNEEREIVVQCIQDWNNLNSADRKIVLLPLRWETHTRPEFGRRPQEIINTTVVDHSDLLIGIFWTRIGTDTGIASSGTIEEIERVAKAGVPVMLYFSKRQIEPEKIDVTQLSKLNEFKSQTYKNALVESYSNSIEFRDKISRHIEMKVRELISLTVSDSEPNNYGTKPADLSIKILHPNDKSKSPTESHFKGEYFDISDFELIEDYEEQQKSVESKNFSILEHHEINKNYYRSLVARHFQRQLFNPIMLFIENIGLIGVRDIHIDINLQSDKEFFFISKGMIIDRITPISESWISYDDDIDYNRIFQKSSSWNTAVELSAIQPKREIQLDIIGYIGAPQSCIINIDATIYGDCFPEPLNKKISINFDVTNSNKTIYDYISNYKDTKQTPSQRKHKS